MIRQKASPEGNECLLLAYVGCVVPDEPEYRTDAYSPSGQLFQLNLLSSLAEAGLPPNIVVSMRSIQSYPRARSLVVRCSRAKLTAGLEVELLPFVNVTPIKQLTIGLGTFVRLLRWGMMTRGAGRRVVYTYNLTVPPGLFTLAAARIIGAKAVVCVADINRPGHTVPATLASYVDFWLQRKLIPRFDGLVVLADSIANSFGAGRPSIRMEGGVSLDAIGAPRDPARLRRDTFTIAAAGSLNRANGVPLILDAFAGLEEQHLRLVIAGRGPLAATVQTAATKDLRIEFIGFVPFARVLELYSEVDLLLNIRVTQELDTAWFFPSKMMEFLASGTPVVSTCTGHVEEEFGKFTYLLREENAHALAELLRRVMKTDASERARMGEMAREYMARHKTWAVQGRRVAEFIRHVTLGHADRDCQSQGQAAVATRRASGSCPIR